MPVGDPELRRALEHVLRRPVGGLARRPHPYASSHALEDVDVAFADGGAPLRVVFKDAGAQTTSAKPARLRDPEREIEAYVDVLAPARIDVPACYGAVVAPGRRWLFLESVDGIPLWQAGAGAAWEAAARWLSRLHAHGVPALGAHLLCYDRAFLSGWLAAARALTPPSALDAVAAVWEDVIERLAAWPSGIVHGDFHPSNVLVQDTADGPRIRAVDWELAGIGPGLLDLAALTSGAWSADERERIALAYHAALPAGLRPPAGELLDALARARLLHAVQWLGWSAGWSPPAAHAHDWLADAAALAREVAA